MHNRTNPATCLHRVIGYGIEETKEQFAFCISCEDRLTDEESKHVAEVYEYDIVGNLWYKPTGVKTLRARRMERAQTRASTDI